MEGWAKFAIDAHGYCSSGNRRGFNNKHAPFCSWRDRHDDFSRELKVWDARFFPFFPLSLSLPDESSLFRENSL